MKRRTFFGAFAALCCLPFAKKEVVTLKGVPIVWEPDLRSGDWSYEEWDGTTASDIVAQIQRRGTK